MRRTEALRGNECSLDSPFLRRFKPRGKKGDCVNPIRARIIPVYTRAFVAKLYAMSVPLCSASNQAPLRTATGARRV